MDRARWGLAGLLAFEGIVAAYLFGIGASLDFSLSYALGALVLASALFLGPQRWQFATLAVLAGYRAWAQTSGGAQLGVYPTWLVPIGFAWLAILPRTLPRIGIAAVALARTWFVVWYFPESTTLVVANVLGAAGAWLWLSAEEPMDGAASLNEDTRVAPP